jgi:hypothetical protein
MLTRNMRVNAENRRKSYYKKIVVKWCIERFRNPSTNYQPYHVCKPNELRTYTLGSRCSTRAK